MGGIYPLLLFYLSKFFRRTRRGDAPPRTDGSGGSKISPYNYINPPHPSRREGERGY